MSQQMEQKLALFKAQATELLEKFSCQKMVVMREVEKILKMGKDLYNEKVSEEHKATIEGLVEKLQQAYNDGKGQLLLGGEKVSKLATHMQKDALTLKLTTEEKVKLFVTKAGELLEKMKSQKTIVMSEVEKIVKMGKDLYNEKVSEEHKATIESLVEKLQQAYGNGREQLKLGGEKMHKAATQMQSNVLALNALSTEEKVKLFVAKAGELLEKMKSQKTIVMSEVNKVVKMGKDLYAEKVSEEHKATIEGLVEKLQQAYCNRKGQLLLGGEQITAKAKSLCGGTVEEVIKGTKLAVVELKDIYAKKESFTSKVLLVFQLLMSYVAVAASILMDMFRPAKEAVGPVVDEKVKLFEMKAGELLEKMKSQKTIVMSEVEKVVKMGKDLYNEKVSEEHKATIGNLVEKLQQAYGNGKEQLLLCREEVQSIAGDEERSVAERAMAVLQVLAAKPLKEVNGSPKTPRAAACS